MEDDSAYILLEILITSLLLAVIVSLLATINLTAIEFWEFNNQRTSLQREALVSIEMIVNIISAAVEVKKITDTKLLLLASNGEWEELYYKPNVGVCWQANNNIISQEVVDLKFIIVNSSLLEIEVTAKADNNRIKKLKTGIEI